MISLVKKTLLVAAMMAMAACTSSPVKSGYDVSRDATANSVKITNMDQNHGGTGIILGSTSEQSFVLTNSHVCGVVEEGGLVSGEAGSFMVSGYKKSKNHDLCLITVAGDLRGGVKIANRPPVPYKEKATISGHPALYPNVKTKGHFSGRQPVQILVGFRPCTEEDAKDERKGMICAIIGAIPLIKSYDSVLVTATIMPGSSGSAVYNSDMELSGVVFAGGGDLGYAWTVPYEYVKTFLKSEIHTLKFEKPTNDVNIFGSSQKSAEKAIMLKLESTCQSPDKMKIKYLCDLLQSQMLM